MEVLTRLQQAGLTANAEKCEFEKDTIDILGHKVTASGVTPYPDRENTIKKHPCPTNTKQLQNFLGVINFYRRFTPGAARTLAPLMEALRGSP